MSSFLIAMRKGGLYALCPEIEIYFRSRFALLVIQQLQSSTELLRTIYENKDDRSLKTISGLPQLPDNISSLLSPVMNILDLWMEYWLSSGKERSNPY